MSSYLQVSNTNNWDSFILNESRHIYHRLNTQWNPWLKIQTSLIPNAGDGLFALRTFGVNDIIGKYTGTLIQQPIGSYVLQTTSGLINGSTGVTGFVHKINDPRGTRKKPNVIFTPGGYVKVIRRIPINTEILVSYGDNYWS